MSKEKHRVLGSRGQVCTYSVRSDTFELNANGFAIQRAGTSYYDPTKRQDVKRGKVSGFSLDSARRLRETLWSADYAPKGMKVFGVCLTLPPQSDDGDGEAVFSSIKSHKAQLFGDSLASLVWRKEVQRNGRVHYHCVVWERLAPTNQPARTEEDGVECVGRSPLLYALVKAWIEGVCRRIATRSAKLAIDAWRGMDWTHRRGFNWDNPIVFKGWPCWTPVDGPSKGVEYLCDHTSKHKAYQAHTKGRAWGVWGRSSLPKVESRSQELSHYEGVALARVARRLSRYWVKDCRSPWGWRWASKGKRFRAGRVVVANPNKAAALSRWLDYVRSSSPAGEPSGGSRREGGWGTPPSSDNDGHQGGKKPSHDVSRSSKATHAP